MTTSLAALWPVISPFLSALKNIISEAFPYAGSVILAVLPFICEFLYKEYLRYIIALGEEISFLDQSLVTIRCNKQLISLYEEDAGQARYVSGQLKPLKSFPTGSLYVSGAQLLPSLGLYNKALSTLRCDILLTHSRFRADADECRYIRRKTEDALYDELHYVLDLAKSPRKNFRAFLKASAKGKLRSEAMLSLVQKIYQSYREFQTHRNKPRKP